MINHILRCFPDLSTRQLMTTYTTPALCGLLFFFGLLHAQQPSVSPLPHGHSLTIETTQLARNRLDKERYGEVALLEQILREFDAAGHPVRTLKFTPGTSAGRFYDYTVDARGQVTEVKYGTYSPHGADARISTSLTSRGKNIRYTADRLPEGRPPLLLLPNGIYAYGPKGRLLPVTDVRKRGSARAGKYELIDRRGASGSLTGEELRIHLDPVQYAADPEGCLAYVRQVVKRFPTITDPNQIAVTVLLEDDGAGNTLTYDLTEGRYYRRQRQTVSGADLARTSRPAAITEYGGNWRDPVDGTILRIDNDLDTRREDDPFLAIKETGPSTGGYRQSELRLREGKLLLGKKERILADILQLDGQLLLFTPTRIRLLDHSPTVEGEIISGGYKKPPPFSLICSGLAPAYPPPNRTFDRYQPTRTTFENGTEIRSAYPSGVWYLKNGKVLDYYPRAYAQRRGVNLEITSREGTGLISSSGEWLLPVRGTVPVVGADGGVGITYANDQYLIVRPDGRSVELTDTLVLAHALRDGGAVGYTASGAAYVVSAVGEVRFRSAVSTQRIGFLTYDRYFLRRTDGRYALLDGKGRTLRTFAATVLGQNDDQYLIAYNGQEQLLLPMSGADPQALPPGRFKLRGGALLPGRESLRSPYLLQTPAGALPFYPHVSIK